MGGVRARPQRVESWVDVRCRGTALLCDIVEDRDVDIVLRDGTTIYADVFCPVTDDPLPAVLAWSPYGKRGGYWRYEIFPGNAGVPTDAVSGLQKFEGPDPAFWCAAGYAVVNVDPRGSFASDGDVQSFSEQEAEDGYDVVEWIATQPWCTGAVAMAGNSWLAITQWMIAAQRPPHLAAIAPWEGLTDVYRDLCARGGIPDLAFARELVANNFGRHRIEDLATMAEAHPLLDDYWRSKIADIEAIEVPAYVVASWTNPIHVRGTLDAFSRLHPDRSWLRVHNTHEWPDHYAHEGDLLAFFDHVLKGIDNGWQDTPRVRMSVLDPGAEDQVDRPEPEWPLTRAEPVAFFLDSSTGSLQREPATAAHCVEYNAEAGAAEFGLTFGRDTELTGPMKLRVWVEADGADDIDLFVYVQKRGSDGEPLFAMYLRGVPSLGAKGQLRASHRELDLTRSTPLMPVHRHESEQPLVPGEAVALDIPIWPASMRWHAGQQLRLVVTGHDLTPPPNPGQPPNHNRNRGRHRVHTGGGYDSHLLVPMLPATVDAAEASA